MTGNHTHHCSKVSSKTPNLCHSQSSLDLGIWCYITSS